MISPRILVHSALIGAVALVLAGCPPLSQCTVPGNWILEEGSCEEEASVGFNGVIELKDDGTAIFTSTGELGGSYAGTWALDESDITIDFVIFMMPWGITATVDGSTMTGTAAYAGFPGEMDTCVTLRKFRYL